MKKQDILVATTCVVLCGAAGVFCAGRAIDATNRVRNDPQWGTMTRQSYTMPEAAHYSMTNTTDKPAIWCGQGIVKSNATGTSVKSLPVCSGIVEPKTTVALVAPYQVGAITELCPGEGLLRVDWKKCTFETIDLK